MEILRIGPLADEALEAAATFHQRDLPAIEALLEAGGPDLLIVFAQADYTHEGWRLAAVQALARRYAPARVNAVACGTGAGDDDSDGAALAATARYCENAPGVTGQYWPLDGTGAGAVL